MRKKSWCARENEHTHYLVTSLFSSRLNREHALGRTGRIQVRKQKEWKKKSSEGQSGKYSESTKPWGRMQSDKRPEQPRRVEGGEGGRQELVDQPGGSALVERVVLHCNVSTSPVPDSIHPPS